MYRWKSLELNAPEIKPSSTPRAAPIRPNERTAKNSRQLKTSLGSGRFFRRKMLTGFLIPVIVEVVRCDLVLYEREPEM